MIEQVQWRNQSIPVLYSKRKTMSLHVKAGDIELRAPKHMPLKTVQEFVIERSTWLEKILAEHQTRASEVIDYHQLNTIPFMGIQVKVHRYTGKRNQWSLAERGLECTMTDTEDRSQYMALINDFYKQQAAFWLPKKTNAIAEELGLHSKLLDVRLRQTKTKWGHCTHEGRIQFNWQIMMAPETIIDYLVAHEVCHLKHLNHSPAFWQTVATAHPRYKNDRQWLKDNGHTLVMS